MRMGNSTIEKTIMTSFLFQGFWDRWVANGVPQETVCELRQRINSLQDWIGILRKYADIYKQRADRLCQQDLYSEAEQLYRLAGIHYYLIQWIFPEKSDEKKKWYDTCKWMHQEADVLTEYEIKKVSIQLDHHDCYGRIRIPEQPKGCIVIINPMDSCKEESISLEAKFTRMGFIVVNFDGPGQGETYTTDQYIATQQRWDLFVNELIEYTASQYVGLSIYLFGISSGGNWAIQGNIHPKVSRTVAVNPIMCEDLRLPDYLTERLSYITDHREECGLPKLKNLNHTSPVLLIDAKTVAMFKDESMYELYNELPISPTQGPYWEEGQSYNKKIDEILAAAAHWYLSS
ncbi:alpha/beta hydrolase [Paenibacillus sp. CMAA1364]